MSSATDSRTFWLLVKGTFPVPKFSISFPYLFSLVILFVDHMRKPGFLLPNMLSSPIYLIIIHLQCFLSFIIFYLVRARWRSSKWCGNYVYEPLSPDGKLFIVLKIGLIYVASSVFLSNFPPFLLVENTVIFPVPKRVNAFDANNHDSVFFTLSSPTACVRFSKKKDYRATTNMDSDIAVRLVDLLTLVLHV